MCVGPFSPPDPPPPAAPPPAFNDAEQQQLEEDERRRLRNAQGRESTILTLNGEKKEEEGKDKLGE